MDVMVEPVLEGSDDEMESELSKQVGVHRGPCHCRVIVCRDMMGGGVVCVGLSWASMLLQGGLVKSLAWGGGVWEGLGVVWCEIWEVVDGRRVLVLSLLWCMYMVHERCWWGWVGNGVAGDGSTVCVVHGWVGGV